MSSKSKTFQFIGMDLEKGSIEKGEVKAIHERGAIASVEQLGLEALSVREVKKYSPSRYNLFAKVTPTRFITLPDNYRLCSKQVSLL